ncbi:dihydrolipoamide acetyltransferase family protein [Saccharospirillum salsuginis]|uniref:Dihydrolipoamide acetyltransferase component of pyruvate dehydrogenase complex n=1 Tax=Saccharospirillum salsuginis TaxID=418750 RepID=A0A918N9B5_9GAMM|nr:dihydrolipoamide acetyltransferase family protein [Saccharospirillum salsuginis]GGX53089.1 dihydrolipoamide acetyltransferase component of pyruvate dehydrogenase complex [Saccharospirillum salsuginis]
MSDFLMPSLGADMDEATLVEWDVKPGDRIKKGDVIAVVETAKGAIEVEVFEEGVVEELYVPVDTVVPVGQPIARLSGVETGAPEAAPPKPAPTVPEQPKPRAAKPEPPVKAPPTPSPEPEQIWERILATPLARKRARDTGTPLEQVRGSGPRGAILAGDLASRPDVNRPARERPSRTGFDPGEMRKAIAAAMARSKREIPHYYLAESIDMKTATDWLSDYNATRPPEQRLLMSVLVFRAVALAAREFPEMNGFHRDGYFEPSDAVHPGIAINLRGIGLITPALLNADQGSLADLMARLQDLTRRARRGGLRSSEMTNATLTITALGERGVESVYGVIYPPQVAILGFGKVTPKPWAVGDALAVRPVMQATLAADHRVSDGHRGGLFLARIAELLQHPDQLDRTPSVQPRQKETTP